jgi:O-antigen ligase/tetratricopeptide (TPR) repeat protein
MKTKPSSVAFQEIVLLALLALVPVVFSRLTQDCFEFPQAALLATGALILLWSSLASELTLAGRSGPGRYLLGAWDRCLSWAGRDPLGVGVSLFLASAVASTVASPNPAQSLHGAPDSSAGLVTAFSTAIVYFASRSVSRGNPAVLTRFARAAGIASAVTSGYALIQLAGLDPLVWGRTATYEGEVRIFGTLGHPNMLGAYLAMTVPLTVWLAARARGSGERVLWALVATASAIVIAATLSRGAWIGLLAGGLAWAALSLLAKGGSRAQAGAPRGGRLSSRVPAAVLASLLSIAAAGLFFARTPMGSHLVERVRQIASLNAPTTQSRLQIWKAGLSMARDHPVFGVGLDAFGTAFPRYRTTAYWEIEWARTPNKAHNEGIDILATQGFVGGGAALIVVLLSALAIVKGARRPEGAARAGAIAVGAVLVAFVVQDLASFTVVALGSLAAAALGWVASSPGTPERREAGARSTRPAPGWSLILAGAPVAALFFLLVIQPVRAQLAEKAALREPAGSPERALALERAAALAPWDARYPGFLGSSLLVQAHQEPSAARARETFRRAAEALRSAIAVEPQNGYTYSNLARVATAQALLRPPDATVEEARRGFAQALQRDPANAEILDQAANAMMQLGQTEEGRSISRRTAALYPDLAQPLALLGYAALLDHRWADAADTLELAGKRQWWGEKAANANAWSNLSAAYLALHRNQDALRAAEEAVALDPSDADARANRDLALARLGKGATPPNGATRPGGSP